MPWWDRLYGRAAAHAVGYALLDLVAAAVAGTLLAAVAVGTALGVLLWRVPAGPRLAGRVWHLLGGAAARTERARLHRHLGVRVDEPPATGEPTRRDLVLGDRRGRRAAGYAAALALWGPLAGGTMVTLLCGGPVLATVPALLTLLAPPTTTQTLFGLSMSPLVLLALSGVGAVMLLVAPPTAWALTRVDRHLVTGLLGPGRVDRLTRRVDTLEVTRERLVEVADAERRRIERDLHDGAQQRLVALAMDLGLARHQLGDAPPQVRQLLDEAHQEAKRAIAELRDVTRGIHPAVLTDRGLDAAMSALAARSPVPVRIDVLVGPRPHPAIEVIAYYVTAEALTNVAKHARATRAAVTVVRHGDRLRVTVTDNGVGGADPARGTGLTGLVDRVAAVDGVLSLSSPPGGPTVLEVDLPCRDRP